MKKQRMIPEIFLSLKDGYSSKKFIKDIISGIIVGIIALPLSIAIAIASGASPQSGLITAIFAGFTAALLGGSKTQISGPEGAFIIVVFGIIASFGFNGLLLATFMSGFIIIILEVLRFGKLIKFIPLPIIIGFPAGIAATIFITQLKDFLGLGELSLPSDVILKFIAILSNLKNTSLITLVMGLIAIFIIQIVPKLQKILPGSLTAIIICTVINFFLKEKCVTLGDIFGSVEIEINPSFVFLDLTIIKKLIVPAFTLAILASIDSLLSAVVADGMTNKKHNPNMELVGQGFANLIAPVFGGLPAAGAIARTSANIRNGGTTPVSALTHSVVIMLIALFLMPLAKYIPMTVLSAVLIVVCYNMVNIREIRKVLKGNVSDILLMLLTFSLTVAFDLVIAILVCTILSFAYHIFKFKIRKKYASRQEDCECVKIKGCLCYMNCEEIMATVDDNETMFDMSEVDEIDATATEFLLGKTIRGNIKIGLLNKKIKKRLMKHKEFTKFIDF